MQKVILSFGETLWDLFSTGPVLGGAPFNFAYRANSLGDRGMIITRLGRDDLGERASQQIASFGMDSRFIQWDNQHPTGTVDVTLDERRNPDYHIVPGVAYDFIEANEELLGSVPLCDCFYFGTLVQRSDQSRQTLYELLEAATGKVRFLDINLRKNCFTRQTVSESVSRAQILKLNAPEVDTVCELVGIGRGTLRDACDRLIERYSLTYCIITMGEGGALALSHAGEQVYVPGYRVAVVDTCGAGDAFSAAFIHQLLRGKSLIECCTVGNALGALVTTQEGATGIIPLEQLEQFIQTKPERVIAPGMESYSIL